jgi:hypothetical protein
MGKLINFFTGGWMGWLASFAGLAAIAAALWFGFNHWEESLRQEGRDEIQKTCDREKAVLQGVADETVRANNVESNRRLAEQQGIIDAANQKVQQLVADVAAGRASHDGLQQRAAVIAARGCRAASDPGTGGASAPASDPAGMLADVLGQLDARAGLLAEYADRARAAGEACEQSYDTLRRPSDR